MLFNAGFGTRHIVVTRLLLQLGEYRLGAGVSNALTIQHHLDAFLLQKKTIQAISNHRTRIDSASETRIFFQICLPLSLPEYVATIARFLTALGFWGDLVQRPSLSRVVACIHCNILLVKIQQNMDYIASSRPLANWGVLPKKKAESYSHGFVICNPSNHDSVSILQRYFCKGLILV